MIFVDTSAILALLDADDPQHDAANDTLRRHLDGELISHNYVVLEATALLQRRFGLQAVRLFTERLLPLLELRWIDAARHGRAIASLFATRRRGVSLVDAVSFDLMRELQVERAFAFDEDFRRAGFVLLD